MIVSIKPGVLIDKLRPQMTLGHVIVASVYRAHGYNCTITSGNDGNHMAGSKHYIGQALDYRTRNVRASDRVNLVNGIKRALGENFDAVLEATHLHVEYDPK